jgi:hypothetical protein
MLLARAIHLLTLVRYLPGRLLPENVVAIPDICEAARGESPWPVQPNCSVPSFLCLWYVRILSTQHVCRCDNFGGRYAASVHRQAATAAQKRHCTVVSRHLSHQGARRSQRARLKPDSALLMHLRALSLRVTTSALFHQSSGENTLFSGMPEARCHMLCCSCSSSVKA